MFRFASGKLGGLFEFQTAFFAVASKQPSHRFWMRGNICQCFVYRDRQRNTFLAGLVVRRPLFCLLPQVCNRIVVWRIRRQRVHREAISMLGKKLLRCLAGVLPCPIMDKQQVRGGLRHDRLPERLGTFRVEPALNALREQRPGEGVNGPKHLGALARATGGDLGLVAPSGPGGTQRAPRRTAGLICKQEQAFPTLSGAQDRGPYVPEPGWTTGGVEMVRHPAHLLKRKPPVVQQRTDRMAIGEDATRTPDQSPDEGECHQAGAKPTTCGPASRSAISRFLGRGVSCVRRPPPWW